MSSIGDNEYRGLTPLLRRVLLSWTRNKLQTSAPGTVVSYDATAQTVSVTPDVGGGTQLDDVPVLFPGTKQGMLEFNLDAGDRVWIFWSKFDLIAWRTGGYVKVSGKRNLLDASSAVCIPWALNSDNLLDRLLPTGGTTGQVVKRTATGYEWADES